MTTELTCPVIIMRHGGLDGVALQKEEYFGLLHGLEMGMHVISGRQERDYAADNVGNRTFHIVDRLDFYHRDSMLLFANQFVEGPETEGARRIDRTEWFRIFERHRKAIFEALDREVASVPNKAPVLVYNLVSLRHAHPAAAVAIRDLIRKYPNQGFLSHSADPDAERPEKVERMHPWALEMISADPPDEPYNGGPYGFDNLYHIVLNPSQRASFVLKYGVPAEHVFEIPDFLAFPGREPDLAAAPEPGVLEAIATRAVVPDGEDYRFVETEVDANTVFFLSPVRPVYRKRLIPAMLVAHAFARSRNERVAFVITHPDVDDPGYFRKTVRFAHALGLPYVHLDQGTIEGLDRAYANLAPLRTIGVVASAAGGWENAINEMARWCIPFFMSAGLNSFPPLTEQIGIETFGMRFKFLEGLIKVRPPEELRDLDLTIAPHMTPLLKWIDTALAPETRGPLVEHNYARAYRHLSLRPAGIRLLGAILKIYSRHGPPGRPGDAVEP